MIETHTDACIHLPMSDRTDCEPIDGVWNQPQGWSVDEAKDDLGDDAPWCAVLHRAHELQAADYE